MAGIAALLEAVAVGAAPPFALIVVDEAGIEAQIAAHGRHSTVPRPGYDIGLPPHGMTAFGDQRMARKRRDGDCRPDTDSRFRHLDPVQLVDMRQVDQQLGYADAVTHIDEKVGSSVNEPAAPVRLPYRYRVRNTQRLSQIEPRQGR